MGVGFGLYMYDVVVKRLRSLSHLLMSSCYLGYVLVAVCRPEINEYYYYYEELLLCATGCFFDSSTETIVSIQSAYSQRDGQTALAMVAGSNTKTVCSNVVYVYATPLPLIQDERALTGKTNVQIYTYCWFARSCNAGCSSRHSRSFFSWSIRSCHSWLWTVGL